MSVRLRALLAVQGLVFWLALLWGGARHILWWQHWSFDGIALAAGLAGAGLAALGWCTPLRSQRRPMAELFGDFSIPLLFALAMLSGIAEEALFRGVLLPETGVLASSLIFSLLHLGTPWAATWSFGAGLLLAFLYLGTGNLLACVLFHACGNLLSFLYIRAVR